MVNKIDTLPASWSLHKQLECSQLHIPGSVTHMKGSIILIIVILSLSLSCLRVESKIMLILFLIVGPSGGGNS